MAQKRTTGAKKASGTKSGRKTSAAAKKPMRREWAALVCAILAFCGILRYFPSTDGLFIEALSRFDTRMVGWGANIVPIMFAVCALILFFHHGRPVKLRIFSTVMIPILIGAFAHLVACDKEYEFSLKIIPQLWQDATEIPCGGVISGTFAVLGGYMLSKFGAGFIFITAIVLFIFTILNSNIRNIAEMAEKYKERERPEYEPDGTPEKDLIKESVEAISRKRRAKQHKREEAAAAAAETKDEAEAKEPAEEQNDDAQKPVSKNRLAAYDLPVDDPILPVKEPKKVHIEPFFEKKPAFFNKNPGVKTPNQVVNTPHADADRISEENTAPQPETQEYGTAPQEEKQAAENSAAKETKTDIATPSAGDSKTAQKENTENQKPEHDMEILESDAQKYHFPPITLLEANPASYSKESVPDDDPYKDRLEMALKSFGINSGITNIVHGPSVTRYEMELAVGVKLNKLTSLSDDIALSLGASGVRIAAIPNKMSTVGIEVPNKKVTKVFLREIIESEKFMNASSKLTFAIGKDISGEPIIGDISKLPHLLVAGTTGSGKSVCLNSLILSILYKARPDEVKFIMVDPKMVEFKIYNGIPHLHTPVVTEAKKASGALQWAVVEMMKRYRLFSETGARELTSYNRIAEKRGDIEKLPQIVVVIDELADLMMVAAKEVEDSIVRIAQMGRAAGIHLVIATQSPRAEIITGLMKANIPSRIALKVSSALESRIILDAGGNADKLVGNGDMLYVPVGTTKPIRVQGTWVSDEEREQIIDFIKTSSEVETVYSEEAIQYMDKAAEEKPENGKQASEVGRDEQYDELLTKAIEVILDCGQASVSMLQRRLKLGYARAARLVDQMEEKGIVGPFEGSKPRQILITKQQWQEMQLIHGTAPIPEANQTMLTADDLFDKAEEENAPADGIEEENV